MATTSSDVPRETYPMEEAPKDGTFIWVEGRFGPVQVQWEGIPCWGDTSKKHDYGWRTRRGSFIFMPVRWWPV